MKHLKIVIAALGFLCFACNQASSKKEEVKNIPTESATKTEGDKENILIGAKRMSDYLHLLEGKNVGMVVNNTSLIDNTHLVDSLKNRGVVIHKIFAPEHGFRGDADAGERVNNSVDEKTNIPIVSIYGKNKKPSKEHLKGIEVMLFDIQDVGVRFYTYISTMHYVMESCAENNIPFIVLDRPNPNGDYVDGPVLNSKFRSFVGMHPIPIVHGCTVGELARMINGERWLKGGLKCKITVVECLNYQHSDSFHLSEKPSPNLPNDLSIRLYPSLCLFEPTQISVGRGTYHPFQQIGFPDSTMGDFSFTPISINGMSKYPKHINKQCFGLDLRNETLNHKFTLKYLITYYQKFPDKSSFFKSPSFFNKLSGNDLLIEQIKKGMSENEIRATWKADLSSYNNIRSKYLLYP